MNTVPTRMTRAGALLAGLLILPVTAPAQSQESSPRKEDEVITMEAVIVRPIEAGAELALQDQRDSGTILNVVSEETLDLLPDQNVGEALSRISGVAIRKDRGEAETIAIRGAAARLNSVTINGDRLGSPVSSVATDDKLGDRGVALHAVPATMVDSIEVMKAIPADQDADSVGGAVNLKTKSATELTGRILEFGARYGYEDIAGDLTYSGEFTFGDRFGEDGQVGMVLSASWEKASRGLSELSYSWENNPSLFPLAGGPGVPQGDDKWVIEDYDVIWRDIDRTRIGANLSLDWRASDNSLFRLGGFFNRFEDEELRRRLQIRFASSARQMEGTTFDSSGVVDEGVVDGGRARRRVRPGTKTTEHVNLYLTGEHRLDDLKFDYRLSYTDSTWSLVRTQMRWEVRSTDLLSGADRDRVADLVYQRRDRRVFDYANPTGWLQSADGFNYGRRGDYTTYDDSSTDENFTVMLNAQRTFDLSDNGELTLRAGYKGRYNDRTFRNGQVGYENDGTPFLMRDFLGANNGRTPERPFGLENGPWSDPKRFDPLLDPSRPEFSVDDVGASGNFTNKEDVNAAYVMGVFKRRALTLNAGLRFEKTDYTGTGFVDTGGAALEASRAEASYENWFPSVILRYQPRENLVLRAAWSNTMGRPNFNDLAPTFNVDAEADTDDPTRGSLIVSGGNPSLNPFESENFDAGFEYYLGGSAVVSGFVFRKSIDNIEYREAIRQNDLPVGEVPASLQPFLPAGVAVLDTFAYTRLRNGDNSTLTGFELVYQQKFNRLPGLLSNLGFIGNATWVDGETDLGQGVKRDFLLEQIDELYNLQLYYETDRWSARLAYNYNGDLATGIATGVEEGELVDNPEGDFINAPEATMDFSFQYRAPFRDGRVTYYFDVKNVLDERARNSFYSSTGVQRPREFQYGGRTYLVGVKFSL